MSYRVAWPGNPERKDSDPAYQKRKRSEEREWVDRLDFHSFKLGKALQECVAKVGGGGQHIWKKDSLLLQGLGIVAKNKDNDSIRGGLEDILVMSSGSLGSVLPVEDSSDKDVDRVWDEDSC